MWATAFARRGSARSSLGAHAGQDRFPRGKVAIERPRVRELDGKELPLASWEQAVDEDWLGQWAMNLMLINVSTRSFPACGTVARGRRSGPARGTLPWLCFGIRRDDRNIYLPYLGWVALDGAVIAGVRIATV